MADELIDIFDENNSHLGIKKMKSEAHKKGLWHRTAQIWIYNSQGDILLQLRSKIKPICPNLWDISVAGHVRADEEPLDSALREIYEEIGLKLKKEDLDFLEIRKVKDVYGEKIDYEFCYIYFLKFNGDAKKLKLQKEEVQEIRFFSIKKLEGELKIHSKSFVPHGNYWFEVIREVQKRVKTI